MDSKMITSLDTSSCRDLHQKQRRPKHIAELGVFEAEKYYKMEIDSRGLDLDLKLGKPIVYSVVVDDRKNVEIDEPPRPKGGSCPKSRENASFSCLLMTGLCSSNEPKAATGDHKTSVRLIRTTNTTKYSCPDRRSVQIIMPNKACPQASPNRPLKVSDKTNPNYKGHHQIRDRADIEASLDRRLAVLTWDAIPGASRKMPEPATVVRKQLDGYESDASSELFEIENLSVSTRQSASTIMPRISVVARRGPAGGLLMGCSGHKSTAVCETSFMKPKHG